MALSHAKSRLDALSDTPLSDAFVVLPLARLAIDEKYIDDLLMRK